MTENIFIGSNIEIRIGRMVVNAKHRGWFCGKGREKNDEV